MNAPDRPADHPSSDARRAGRGYPDRRWCADRRAVDDQHRHGGHRGDGRPGQGARRRRLGARPHHGQHRGGRCRGSCHPRTTRCGGLQGPADRRFSFQRAQAPLQLPGLRPGARQVPHQSRQCRQGRAPRPAVRRDDRAGDRLRQAGAHRRQLGQPRPGFAGEPHGRERPVGESARRRQHHARGAHDLRDSQRAVRRSVGPARRPHRPGVQGFQRAGSHRRLHGARAALRLSAASRPDRGRHGQQGHRGVDGGARRAAAARHRRHDPDLAHAGAERRPDARGDRRAGDPADDGAALLLPARERLSRMRPHDERLISRCSPTRSSRICEPRCPPGARSITASRT